MATISSSAPIVGQLSSTQSTARVQALTATGTTGTGSEVSGVTKTPNVPQATKYPSTP